LLLALACGPGIPAQPPGKPPPPGGLPPFLEEFRARNEPTVVTREVRFPSAAGTVRGYLARQDVREALPAVLLIHDQAGLSDWVKQSARELASIGYVVLAVDLGGRVPPPGKSPGPAAALADEPTLADLSAAVRWLRRRPDVLPECVGVVGWAWGADLALALAAATPVQACVVCYGSLAADAALLGGLRTTPLMILVAGKDRSLPAFRKALEGARILHRVRVYDGVSPGFMTPRPGKPHAHDETEEAWVEIYNFLGKYVEDAPDNGPAFAGAVKAAPPDKEAAIADLMRAVNEPTGVRGALIRALAKKPAALQEWETVRANAALIAEAGVLLEHRTPRKGAHGHWLQQARAYTAAARAVVAAADRQDYAGARRALGELGERCAACHKQHR
jgi:carboxymethylenebutenolidase